MRADALIIGGGLMGSSTALHLARRGVRSLVLEKDSPGRHASGVNAGGLRRLNRHPAEIPLSVAAADDQGVGLHSVSSGYSSASCPRLRGLAGGRTR